MQILEWFLKQPVWVRYALAALLVYLVLKGYGYVAPIVTQPGLN